MPKNFGEAPEKAASRETFLENLHFWKSARKGSFAENIFEKLTCLVKQGAKTLIFLAKNEVFCTTADPRHRAGKDNLAPVEDLHSKNLSLVAIGKKTPPRGLRSYLLA